jgi:hypothetical protein
MVEKFHYTPRVVIICLTLLPSLALWVPLSTVALTEDMGMASMALAMLFIH